MTAITTATTISKGDGGKWPPIATIIAKVTREIRHGHRTKGFRFRAYVSSGAKVDIFVVN
jgi:hypothetical protein